MRREKLDIEKLKEFFEKHRYYTTYELATLAGRAPSTIQYWREKSGYRSNKPAPSSHGHVNEPGYKRKRKRKFEKLPKSVWDNAEWFHKTYNGGFGLQPIAEMTGLNKSWVIKRLQKYGVRIKSNAEANVSKNPYRTKEWLIDTYVNQKWTTAQCAKVANVSPHTICKWLAHFNLNIRDRREARALKPHQNGNSESSSA